MRGVSCITITYLLIPFPTSLLKPLPSHGPGRQHSSNGGREEHYAGENECCVLGCMGASLEASSSGRRVYRGSGKIVTAQGKPAMAGTGRRRGWERTSLGTSEGSNGHGAGTAGDAEVSS